MHVQVHVYGHVLLFKINILYTVQASQYNVCDRTHRTINVFARLYAQTCVLLSNRTHYFTIKFNTTEIRN